MQHTIIPIKHTPIKLDFTQQNQISNIKSASAINNSPNRLPFIVLKYSAEDHIPAEIHLVSLHYT